MAAYLNTHGGASPKPEVEQKEVGLVVANESPIFRLIVCSAYYLRLGNVVADNSFCTFEFEGHILYYYYLEIIHVYFYFNLFMW